MKSKIVDNLSVPFVCFVHSLTSRVCAACVCAAKLLHTKRMRNPSRGGGKERDISLAVKYHFIFRRLKDLKFSVQLRSNRGKPVSLALPLASFSNCFSFKCHRRFARAHTHPQRSGVAFFGRKSYGCEPKTFSVAFVMRREPITKIF